VWTGGVPLPTRGGFGEGAPDDRILLVKR